MEFSVYIMTNISRKPLYVGVTNNLQRRIYEHKNSLCEGFTKKYKMTQLVYYELYQYVWDAIAREKSLKLWKREWKLQLVETVNPEWEDLGNLICR
jgi:putative endonuclease